MLGTQRKKTAEAVRLVPAMIDGPLADVGPEAAVTIRFPVTGPVVEISNVRRVPSAWVSELLAPMVAAVWSR